MFSILLVLFVITALIFRGIAKGALKVVDTIGDPRDRVAKMNGSYHQAVKSGKEHLANGIVAAKHTPDKARSMSQSVRSVAAETKNRVQAEVTYHRIQRRNKAS